MFKSSVKSIAGATWRMIIEIALVLAIINLVQDYGFAWSIAYLALVVVAAFVTLVLFAWYNYHKLVKQFSEELHVSKEKAKEVINNTFAKGVGK